jgi:methylmalonyl-CoA mutase N-terminal domain/subunit
MEYQLEGGRAYGWQMSHQTEAGWDFEPVYGPDKLADFDPAEKLGTPGQYPFTRGVYPTMYTQRPWTMR